MRPAVLDAEDFDGSPFGEHVQRLRLVARAAGDVGGFDDDDSFGKCFFAVNLVARAAYENSEQNGDRNDAERKRRLGFCAPGKDAEDVERCDKPDKPDDDIELLGHGKEVVCPEKGF